MIGSMPMRNEDWFELDQRYQRHQFRTNELMHKNRLFLFRSWMSTLNFQTVRHSESIEGCVYWRRFTDDIYKRRETRSKVPI